MGALRVLCRVWTEEFESIGNFLYLNKENCTAYVNESSLTYPNAWSPLNRIPISIKTLYDRSSWHGGDISHLRTGRTKGEDITGSYLGVDIPRRWDSQASRYGVQRYQEGETSDILERAYKESKRPKQNRKGRWSASIDICKRFTFSSVLSLLLFFLNFLV